MSTILAVINIIILAVTLIVLIIYTIKTGEMARATADMAKASQEQRYDQLRPLLIPEGEPAFREESEHPSWLSTFNVEQGYSIQRLSIRNVGVGPALTVVSVLYPCESIVVDNTGAPKRERFTARWMGRLEKPLVSNEVGECVLKLGNEKPSSASIETYDLSAPPEPTLAQIMGEHMPVHAARMSITYQDVFGRKHVSVFDYVQRWRGNPAVHGDLRQHAGWEFVAFSVNITKDLNDIFGTPSR